MGKITVWNPDLAEGPDNVRPPGEAGQALTPAQQWASQNGPKAGKHEYKNKGGRPPTVIDWVVFAELCSMFATKQEIAGWFKCSEDAIERACKREFGDKYTFKVVWNELSAQGKISLRREQKKQALKGNTLMLIWLGKQYLNQRDTPQPDVEDDEDDTKNGQISDVYGVTFVGAPGQEQLPVNAPPEAVRPSNASQPGPDLTEAQKPETPKG